MEIREMAATFEAVKIAWRQSKDGMILTLAIHPNDVNVDVANARIGTRFQVALVEITDDGQPVAGPDATEAEKALRVAGALCRDERFWQWIASYDGVFVESEAEAAEWLRDELEISSRSVIKTDPRARQAFNDLKERFLEDFRRSR